MIEVGRGNLLEADVEALVNTVNCDGFMGKGIALQFKQAFPENFKAYQKACRAGEVVPGRMFVFDNQGLVHPRFIINFPTKKHWRSKSRIKDIESGLQALVEDVRNLGIRSIAVPPLGCGLGGLKWRDVGPRIERAFAALSDVRTLVFEPQGAPDAKSMPVRTQRPAMTRARALCVMLMERYAALEYSCTLLEVQKLAYFLQAAEEPLQLDFVPGKYGPYAAKLNKVLEVMEGHFIRGYGDSQDPGAEIELLADAVVEADQLLRQHEESLGRLKAVTDLIEGFETPYGMELLATVHWVAHLGVRNNSSPASTPDEAVRQVQSWNPRKRQLFRPAHIRIAWQNLDQLGWLRARASLDSHTLSLIE